MCGKKHNGVAQCLSSLEGLDLLFACCVAWMGVTDWSKPTLCEIQATEYQTEVPQSTRLRYHRVPD